MDVSGSLRRDVRKQRKPRTSTVDRGVSSWSERRTDLALVAGATILAAGLSLLFLGNKSFWIDEGSWPTNWRFPVRPTWPRFFNAWTFRNRRTASSFFRRLLRFHAVAGLANYAPFLTLVTALQVYDVRASRAGILVAVLINCFINLWTWHESNPSPAATAQEFSKVGAARETPGR